MTKIIKFSVFYTMLIWRDWIIFKPLTIAIFQLCLLRTEKEIIRRSWGYGYYLWLQIAFLKSWADFLTCWYRLLDHMTQPNLGLKGLLISTEFLTFLMNFCPAPALLLLSNWLTDWIEQWIELRVKANQSWPLLLGQPLEFQKNFNFKKL